jgi:hypothetical protein
LENEKKGMSSRSIERKTTTLSVPSKRKKGGVIDSEESLGKHDRIFSVDKLH